MIQRGQHPIFQTDTQAVLEEVVFHLEEEHDALYRQKRDEEVDRVLIPQQISEELNFANILQASACHWDGGYVIAGAVGNGDVHQWLDRAALLELQPDLGKHFERHRSHGQIPDSVCLHGDVDGRRHLWRGVSKYRAVRAVSTGTHGLNLFGLNRLGPFDFFLRRVTPLECQRALYRRELHIIVPLQ